MRKNRPTARQKEDYHSMYTSLIDLPSSYRQKAPVPVLVSSLRKTRWTDPNTLHYIKYCDPTSRLLRNGCQLRNICLHYDLSKPPSDGDASSGADVTHFSACFLHVQLWPHEFSSVLSNPPAVKPCVLLEARIRISDLLRLLGVLHKFFLHLSPGSLVIPEH